ncbi:MAG: hypothetical protein OXI96_01605 [Acidimicrobiaceae bacterium]|nr:hypothetical protein [Acidimicrobiaceae bacterium]
MHPAVEEFFLAAEAAAGQAELTLLDAIQQEQLAALEAATAAVTVFEIQLENSGATDTQLVELAVIAFDQARKPVLDEVLESDRPTERMLTAIAGILQATREALSRITELEGSG